MATKIEKAKTQIVFNHGFYACILLRRPIVVTRDVPTAGINREGQIYVNPDFIEPLSNAQVQFLLLHECWHWLKMSFLRKEWRNDEIWNLAEDAVINESLVAEGFEFVPGGVRFPGAEHMSGEEVYEKLMEQAKKRGGAATARRLASRAKTGGARVTWWTKENPCRRIRRGSWRLT